METYWEYELDPSFPFQAFEYVTVGDQDKLHWHDYLQLGLCLEGTGKFIFSKKEFNVKEGDVFLVSNFENHVAIANPGETTKYLFVVFLPELIAPPGSRLFDFEYLAPFWYDLDVFSNKISDENNTRFKIQSTLMEIKKLWDQKDIAYKHLVEANLRKILAELILYSKHVDPNYLTVKLGNQMKLQPALTYINRHFRENIPLEAVAAILHMSESRFRHFFKEVTSFSFKEYVAYLRVNEAKKLLVTTDLKISEMINQVGCSNMYQFYKLFDKYVSMTPAEYREQHQRGYSARISSNFTAKP